MQKNKINLKIVFAFLLPLLIMSCTKDGKETDGKAIEFKNTKNEVIIHELSDPDKLNPITSTSANGTYIQNQIWLRLIDIDLKKAAMSPSLAVALPTVTAVEEGEYAGGMKIEYEIRPEAKWDNGTDVTGHDVEFTIKTAMNPKVDAEHLRPYLEFLTDIEIDKDNPKKFIFWCKNKYFDAVFGSGGQAHILPEYHYDPEKLMRKVDLSEFSDPKRVEELRSDPDLMKFAQAFNSEKYQRESEFISGSGAYTLEKWTTQQRITLVRKENWWGDALKGVQPVFDAEPKKLTYEIINDQTTSITALKDQSLDVMRGIKAKDYTDLQKNDKVKKIYHLFEPMAFAYTYLGMNMKKAELADVRVRKAIGHLLDREQIIEIVLYGLADPTNGPFNPVKPYYNKSLTGFDFNVAKANQLLDEAGWVDSDSDGIRDKMIEGKKHSLKLVYKYNSGNATREQIGLFLQETAKQAGIAIEVVSREWTVFIDETKKHDFEIYCGGWVQDPISDDPKQLWHTNSYNGGSNYVGFGNAKSDALIEKIQETIIEEDRYKMYMELQQIIADETPYIFIYSPRNLISISKRFDNAEAYIARPGYNERSLRLGISGNKALAN
ncbi:MAG: ABC transporter substrate-binding protein [Chitinophagales bacterium]|nr:ABC transporter substrate-binding protein [Chitinophagales bacterium]